MSLSGKPACGNAWLVGVLGALTVDAAHILDQLTESVVCQESETAAKAVFSLDVASVVVGSASGSPMVPSSCHRTCFRCYFPHQAVTSAARGNR